MADTSSFPSMCERSGAFSRMCAQSPPPEYQIETERDYELISTGDEAIAKKL